jgi:hypothetical protein
MSSALGRRFWVCVWWMSDGLLMLAGRFVYFSTKVDVAQAPELIGQSGFACTVLGDHTLYLLEMGFRWVLYLHDIDPGTAALESCQ